MILIMSHFRFSSALMRKPLPRKITNALMLIFTRAYIRLEKRFTNLGGLYLGELIHGGGGAGGYLRNFTVCVLKNFANSTENHLCWRLFNKVAILKALLKRDFNTGVFP